MLFQTADSYNFAAFTRSIRIDTWQIIRSKIDRWITSSWHVIDIMFIYGDHRVTQRQILFDVCAVLCRILACRAIQIMKRIEVYEVIEMTINRSAKWFNINVVLLLTIFNPFSSFFSFFFLLFHCYIDTDNYFFIT